MRTERDVALQMVADHRAGIQRPLSPGCVHITLGGAAPQKPKQERHEECEAITAEWSFVTSGRDGVPYELIKGIRDAALPAAIAAVAYVLYRTGDMSSSLSTAIIIPMALIALAALVWPWLRK